MYDFVYANYMICLCLNHTFNVMDIDNLPGDRLCGIKVPMTNAMKQIRDLLLLNLTGLCFIMVEA